MTQVSAHASPRSDSVAQSVSGVLALDIGSTKIRAAVASGGVCCPIPLSQTGLVPGSLTSLRETAAAQIDFPGLMERMGEDAPVTFDYQTEKPHIYLRNLLAGLHVPLNVWWGPLSAAGIVVSGFANDLQRSLVQKAARMAGWASCTLVNKTTALAVHALRRNRPGQYLSPGFPK